jgi:hypothetical protein
LAGLGIFILVEAFGLEYAGDFGPGPGFLPFWLGIVIAGLAALLISTALRKSARPRIAVAEVSGDPARAMLSWFAIVLTVPLLAFLGFYAAFAILTAFLVLAMEKRPVSTALAVAVGCVLGFYLIFSVALGVRLPPGPWGF